MAPGALAWRYMVLKYARTIGGEPVALEDVLAPLPDKIGLHPLQGLVRKEAGVTAVSGLHGKTAPTSIAGLAVRLRARRPE